MTGDVAPNRDEDPGDNSDEQAVGRRRGLTALTAGILAALLGLAFGFATGVFAAMPGHPGEDSPEAGFARDMSTHHAQAVQMSMIAWQSAALPEVRTLSYDIATTQQAQIGMMRGWLETWEVSQTSDDPPMAWMHHGEHMRLENGRMPGMASRERIEELRNARGPKLDVLFCQLMIEHHKAGVTMAEEIVERTDDRRVRELAESMVIGQQNEITVLRNLKKKAEGLRTAGS